MPMPPAYLAIAADLRAAILSGELPAGAKLPSESGLMRQYDVSRTVAKWAIAVLKGVGIVEGRAGSGVYVRDTTRLVRHARGRDVRSADGPTSPYARDAAEHFWPWNSMEPRVRAVLRIAGSALGWATTKSLPPVSPTRRG